MSVCMVEERILLLELLHEVDLEAHCCSSASDIVVSLDLTVQGQSDLRRSTKLKPKMGWRNTGAEQSSNFKFLDSTP